MENLLYFKFAGNINNLYSKVQTSSEAIQYLTTYNQYIVFLLKSNTIVSYNPSEDKYLDRNFNSEGIVTSFKINGNRTSPLMFVLIDNTIELIDFKTFLPVKTYELDSSLVDFAFFESFNNYTLEIIYVTARHEIVYFSKGLIMDNRKLLSSEKVKIDRIEYQEPYLYWSFSHTLKIFDLQKKVMIYKKGFDPKIRPMILKPIEELFSGHHALEFIIQDKDYVNIICRHKYLTTIQLITEQVGESLYNYKELFTLDLVDTDNEYIIASWMTASKDKICVLKSVSTSVELGAMSIEIYTLNDHAFTKSFRNILLKNINLSFNPSTYNLILYDSSIYYSLLLQDRKSNIISSIKAVNLFRKECLAGSDEDASSSKESSERYKVMLSNFNYAIDFFDELKFYDEQKLVISSIITHLKSYISKSNQLKIEKTIVKFILSSSKLSIGGASTTNVIPRPSMAIDCVVELLLKQRHFEYCYSWISRFVPEISDKVKEKVIIHLVAIKNFGLLELFLNSITQFDNCEARTLEFLDLSLTKVSQEDKVGLFKCCILINVFLKNHESVVSYIIALGKLDLELNQVADTEIALPSSKGAFEISNSHTKTLFSYIKNNNQEEFILDLKFQRHFLANFSYNQIIQILDYLVEKQLVCSVVDLIKSIFSICEPSKIEAFIQTLFIVQKRFDAVLLAESKEPCIFQLFIDKMIEINLELMLHAFIQDCPKMNYTLIYNYICTKYPDSLHNIKILLMTKLQKYKNALEIILTSYRDPEMCIRYIEDLKVAQASKQEFYFNLESLINTTNYLTTIQKFYFISLFKKKVRSVKIMLVL